MLVITNVFVTERLNPLPCYVCSFWGVELNVRSLLCEGLCTLIGEQDIQDYWFSATGSFCRLTAASQSDAVRIKNLDWGFSAPGNHQFQRQLSFSVIMTWWSIFI